MEGAAGNGRAPDRPLVAGPGSPSGDGVWLGVLAETGSGTRPRVWLSTTKEQVVAVVGKRGSGKSFTLGVIAEDWRAVGIHHRTATCGPGRLRYSIPSTCTGRRVHGRPSSDEAELRTISGWRRAQGLPAFPPLTWRRGSLVRAIDFPPTRAGSKLLNSQTSVLGLEEWELLLGVNVMTEPMGQALTDALSLVSRVGFRRPGNQIPPSPTFDLRRLRISVDSDELEASYHRETLRALRQRLASRSPQVFSLAAPVRQSKVLWPRGASPSFFSVACRKATEKLWLPS